MYVDDYGIDGLYLFWFKIISHQYHHQTIMTLVLFGIPEWNYSEEKCFIIFNKRKLLQ